MQEQVYNSFYIDIYMYFGLSQFLYRILTVSLGSIRCLFIYSARSIVSGIRLSDWRRYPHHGQILLRLVATVLQ